MPNSPKHGQFSFVPASQPAAQQLSTDQAMALAAQLQSQGRLQESEQLLQQILQRQPDHAFALHTRLFNRKQEHTYDLAELGRYYADYARLMDHWRKVLPAGAFLDINYEDIVADQEAQARRMLDYCGLPWNPACLEFHKTKRQVRTASVTQVRQPIYTTSVERWRKYEKFLGPLLDELGDLVPRH